MTLQGFKRRVARALGVEPNDPARANEPDVSVIIPCYNAEATVAETLTSLQAQTHPNWEAICVDDGSTDATPRWLEVWRATDPRIRCQRIEHAGPATARNVGIQMARAPRLLFLDADDIARADALATLHAVANAVGDHAALAPGYDVLDQHGIPLGETRYAPTKPLHLDRLLAGNTMPPVALLPARLLHDNGFDAALPACVDWDFWCRLADRGARAVSVRRTLFGIRLHENSLARNIEQRYRAGRDLVRRWYPRRGNLHHAAPPAQQWVLRCGAQASAAGDPAALARYWAELGPTEPAPDFPPSAAAAIQQAYTCVHGACGHTWNTHAATWMAQIEHWLADGPLADQTDEILAELHNIRPPPDNRLKRVRQFLQRRPDVTRVVVYGLDDEGAALLDRLRRDPCLGRRHLLITDDQADALRYLAQFLPREDLRKWRAWPHNTAVIVTTDPTRETEHQLARRGGRPGEDFITVRRETPAVIRAEFAAAHA